MSWEPIETAPMDGTHVLLFVRGLMIEGWWGKPPCFYANGWQFTTLSYHGCDCCSNDADKPTHWMPLPDPPSV